MTLRLPSEIVVERFLPTMRVLLAQALHDSGLTQQEVADKLGVTQAAVSRYVSGEADVEPRIAEDPRTADTVERIASGFVDETVDEYEALAELVELVRAFEDRGPICAIHEEEMPALQGLGCDLCLRGKDEGLQAERDVLADVRKAARAFARIPGVIDVIPNVGTNVGMALPDPQDTTDVAAIPGRIYEMDGRVEIPSNPEFGASRHVSETILAATAVDPSIRGAINLRTTDRVIEAARDLGLDPIEIDAEYEDRGDRLRDHFESEGVRQVVYHEGAFGIEPITYILAGRATSAVELVGELLDRSNEAGSSPVPEDNGS